MILNLSLAFIQPCPSLWRNAGMDPLAHRYLSTAQSRHSYTCWKADNSALGSSLKLSKDHIAGADELFMWA